MAFILTNSKVALFSPTEVVPTTRTERLGRHYLLITVPSRISDVANALIDAILNLNNTDEVRINALGTLAKANVFDMIVATPYSRTSRSGPENTNTEMKPDLDYYLRCTVTDYTAYVDGEVSGIHLTKETVKSWSPELTKVIESTSDRVGALEGLKQANIIGSYKVYELPWMERFFFTQPKNSELPEDYSRGY